MIRLGNFPRVAADGQPWSLEPLAHVDRKKRERATSEYQRCDRGRAGPALAARTVPLAGRREAARFSRRRRGLPG